MGNRVRFMSKWKTIRVNSESALKWYFQKKKPDSDDFQTSFN